MCEQNNAEKIRAVLGELILKCWKDDSFKESFKKDPKKYLADAGVEIPENMNFTVLEQTEKISYMVLPVDIDMQTVQKTMLEIINKTAQKEFRLPENGELRIVQNTGTMEYILIPLKPAADNLTADDLEKVAGGAYNQNSNKPVRGGFVVAVIVGS